MGKQKNEVSRRGFLENTAASTLGASLVISTGGTGTVTATSTGGGSRVLTSRPGTISVVSYPPLPSDEPDRLTKTLKRMASYVRQAGQLKSDLVAFPEICNTLGASKPWQFEPLDGPTLAAMSKVAKQNSIYVVCPLATLENGTRYNSSVLVGRQGQIEGVYHKNFPTHGELDVGIIPGTEVPVFETDFGRVGLSICFDLNYWEVGSGLCANQAELVIWSSMWEGSRMLTKWAIEFGFFIAASYSRRSTITDIVGREIVSLQRNLYDRTDGAAAPLVTATIDMDRRLLHHDENLDRLEAIFEKYDGSAVYAEWLPHECLLILGSQVPGVSTDQLIEEFNLEPMRDYLARVRLDRQRALEGDYPVKNRD